MLHLFWLVDFNLTIKYAQIQLHKNFKSCIYVYTTLFIKQNLTNGAKFEFDGRQTRYM